MDIYTALDELQQKAKHDPEIKAALLATRSESNPVDAFLQQMPGIWIRNL